MSSEKCILWSKPTSMAPTSVGCLFLFPPLDGPGYVVHVLLLPVVLINVALLIVLLVGLVDAQLGLRQSVISLVLEAILIPVGPVMPMVETMDVWAIMLRSGRRCSKTRALYSVRLSS